MPAKRLLIVDDDVVVRLMLREVLEQAGYHVDTLDRAQRLRAALTAHQPDLVLLDVFMPYPEPVGGGDTTPAGGLTALAAVSGGGTPPIILMSADLEMPGGTRVADAAAGLGVTAFIAKPFHTPDLLTLIAHTLEASDGEA